MPLIFSLTVPINICIVIKMSQAMSVIYILIAFSLIIALVFLGAFIWSIKNGQYEDDYTPSVRILFDDQKSQSK